MPAVRHTPKRQRDACPVCGRDMAFTRPHRYSPDQHLARVRVFSAHKTPEGAPCVPGNGKR